MATEPDQPTTTPERLDGPMPDPAEGVFETTLVVDGGAVALEAHLSRLEASLAALYGDELPSDAGELATAAAASLELGRLRLTVRPGGRPTARALAVEPSLVFPEWGRAVEVGPVTIPGGIGAHKWADRRLLERAEARVAPGIPLVMDVDGAALEGSRGSLFLVSAGRLLTPPTDGRLLPGITRAQMIAVAGVLGIEVREEAVSLEGLAAADEVFMTGAVRGVEPVRRCSGVAAWGAGEVTARVAAELRRFWLG